MANRLYHSAPVSHKDSPSYDSGISSTPLIGESIGVHFDRTVQRWPESVALISPQQVRLFNSSELYIDLPDAFHHILFRPGHLVDVARAGRQGGRVRGRPAGAGPQAGRSRGHLLAESRRVDRGAVRHRQGRTHPGTHNTRYS